MESYFVDQAILEEFADHLISEKYPDQPVSAHANTKKEIMRGLDHQILKSILGNLTKEQGAELNLLMDKSEDEETFMAFFADHNINLTEIIKDTMVEFKDNFLKGGENA